MKNKEEILSKIKTQAITLLEFHKKQDPYTKIALWFPNTKESRLLEVSFRLETYDVEPEELLICRYSADEEISFPHALTLVSFGEYQYYIKHKNKFKEQSKGWDLDKAEILMKEIEDDFVLDQNEKVKQHIDNTLIELDSALCSLNRAKEVLSKDIFDKYIESISNIHKEMVDNFVGKSLS
jgi:hypothetical protein